MTARGGLGRGLSALIPTGAAAFEEIPADAITPNSRQPRKEFDEEGISNLAASIRQVGILQPVVVRPAGPDRYELVVGERRWRAAQRAGLATIPALVVSTDDRGALERAIVENIHRHDLNALEEAAAYDQLIQEAGLTHERLAERLGLSRPAVTNALRLLELPTTIQAMALEGKISATHARALLGLGNTALMERAAQRVVAEALSVRETEDLVRRMKEETGLEPPSTSRREGRAQPAGVLEASQLLSDELMTRVTVTMGSKKGKIVIEFGSVDDLERIFRRIVSAGPAPQKSETQLVEHAPSMEEGVEL